VRCGRRRAGDKVISLGYARQRENDAGPSPADHLPPLTTERAWKRRAYSAVGRDARLGESLLSTRPFQNPHHTIRTTGWWAGEHQQPGEILLAHHGVLFLDELPEFNRRQSRIPFGTRRRGPRDDQPVPPTPRRSRPKIRDGGGDDPVSAGSWRPEARLKCAPIGSKKYMGGSEGRRDRMIGKSKLTPGPFEDTVE